VGELLAAFLSQSGLGHTPQVAYLTMDLPGLERLVRYDSRSQLGKVVKDLLEYSNNFMTNQLWLFLGSVDEGGQATLAKAQRGLDRYLKKVGVEGAEFVEASGLSRKNRISPQAMMQLLRYFEKYREYLPIKEKFFKKPVFLAKTGTLSDASAYAGYMKAPDGQFYRFVYLINTPTGYAYKFSLAKMMYQGLFGAGEI
jgi:D-alanyl-D-alanine carboxypeptidase/D-alanyl-D-alanine-endopeptidase (penicillin-binding protein 4)